MPFMASVEIPFPKKNLEFSIPSEEIHPDAARG